MYTSGGPKVSNLFPAIAQTFAVIFIGYLFGLFKIISPSESRSISQLVGKLTLPALLFQNLAILDLTAISWPFLAGILVAKGVVFAVVVILTVIVSRPRNIGKAGLFGIFATQSNDFALGLPIVVALYGHASNALGNFNYTSYIYLLAPVSLVMINPIGFFMMEYHKQSSRTSLSCRHIPSLLWRTVRGVLFNPVIFMTALGVIVNAVVYFGIHKGERESKDNLPEWLMGFLTILGSAYAACALFLIGLFMVGKIKKLTGMVILLAALLIVAKTILLPILANRVLFGFLPHGASNSSRDDIATFGFLYGTFPTAPTVFIYASQYNLAMEIIAASLVLCTVLSAPIMYISARMVLITYASSDQYARIILNTRRDVTVITVVSVVCVFVLFLLARRYRSYIHVIIMHLMVAMLLECIAGELLDVFNDRQEIYWQFLWFSIFFTSVLATRTWLAVLATGLALLLHKGGRVAEKAWLPMMLLGWGIPLAITITMVAVVASNPANFDRRLVDISFLFGQSQLIVTLVVLVACFVVGVVMVILAVMAARKLREKERTEDGTGSPQGEQRGSVEQPAQAAFANPAARRSQSPGGTKAAINYGSYSTSAASSEASLQAPSRGSEDVRLKMKKMRGGSKTSLRSKSKNLSLSGDLASPPGETGIGTIDERIPLLDRPSSPESHGMMTGGFGDLPDSGLWNRDISGRDISKVLILLLFLLFSCAVGILIVSWKLSSKAISGIFIAVNVMDTVTNFGQGFFVLMVFGFEKHWFWMAAYRKLRKIWFRIETVVLPPEKEQSIAVVNLCNTFKAQYLEACKAEIVSDKR